MKNNITVFPRIIAGGDYFHFSMKRGRLFEGRRLLQGGDYFNISNISHKRSCPMYMYFVFSYQAITDKVKYMNITIEKTIKKAVLL